MELLILRSLWTNRFNLEGALADCASGLFDGVEGPVPTGAPQRRQFLERIADSGVPFVAEIVTGGGYVPTDRSLAAHVEDFRRGAEQAAEGTPLFASVVGGCDSWSLAQSVHFFGEALHIASRLGMRVSFETHRSRPTYAPWAVIELFAQLPALQLTCDFSHWCCVCERLVLDSEPDILKACAARAAHVHARVGYSQGPQVPDPAADLYRAELEAHERWWAVLWDGREGGPYFTITPEFGPDGYMQIDPATGRPAADLDLVNRWMAKRLRLRFQEAAA